MLEADDTGTLIIPAELLGYPEPNTRYIVEQTKTNFRRMAKAMERISSSNEPGLED